MVSEEIAGDKFEGVMWSRRRRVPRPQQLPLQASGLDLGTGTGSGGPDRGRGYFLLTGGGGGRSECDKLLPPLPGAANVTADGFQTEDEALAETLRYLNQGDVDNTFATFYGDVHAFTHNIQPDVRAVDEQLANTLCELVIELEEEYDPPPTQQRSPVRMASTATALREHLRDIAEALGFPRPRG